MFHAFIASTVDWSGCALSHRPLPWTHANSALDRLTPSSRYVLPASVSSLLPDTCSAGAAPPDAVGLVLAVGLAVVLGLGLVGRMVGVVVGEEVTTTPVHVTPFTVNDAGTGLLPLQEPMKPSDTEA